MLKQMKTGRGKQHESFKRGCLGMAGEDKEGVKRRRRLLKKKR